MTNRELARKYYESWNNEKYDEMKEYLCDNLIFSIHNNKLGHHIDKMKMTKDEYTKGSKEMESFTKCTFINEISDNEQVFHYYIGEIGNQKWHVNEVMKFENNKIKEITFVTSVE